jgi:hypothetical protein
MKTATKIQQLKLNIEIARADLKEAKLEFLKEQLRRQKAEPCLREKMATLMAPPARKGGK